jgi:hypothetical protein
MPERPTIYNRPWHFDADERRHHGRRQWDPSVIESLVELLSSVEGVYPPDWSERDVVRFRVAGSAEPFAELWTDEPSTLRFVIHSSRTSKPVIDGCRIHVDDRRCEVLLKTPVPLRTPAFADLVREVIAQASGHSRSG